VWLSWGEGARRNRTTQKRNFARKRGPARNANGYRGAAGPGEDSYPRIRVGSALSATRKKERTGFPLARGQHTVNDVSEGLRRSEGGTVKAKKKREREKVYDDKNERSKGGTETVGHRALAFLCRKSQERRGTAFRRKKKFASSSTKRPTVPIFHRDHRKEKNSRKT